MATESRRPGSGHRGTSFAASWGRPRLREVLPAMMLSSLRSRRPAVAAALLILSVTCAACAWAGARTARSRRPLRARPRRGGDAGTSGPTSTPDRLLGQWTLVSVVRNGVSETVPKGTGSFTVTFQSDGRLGMRADCNACGGAYQADGPASLSATTLPARAPTAARRRSMISSSLLSSARRAGRSPATGWCCPRRARS